MTRPGWFGKLPMMGDFAHRSLPPPFVDACDAWLSQGIAASREALGAGWRSSYLTAPLWRFAWSPRIVDAQWWFGVLMPSVDAVGRYFPLVIAASTPQAPSEAPELLQWAQWYERVSRCAMQTLQDGATLVAFESALAAVATPVTTAPAGSAAANGSAWRLQPIDSAWPGDAATIVLRALAARLQDHSIWWPQPTSSEDAPAVTVMQGLPSAKQFAGLLNSTL